MRHQLACAALLTAFFVTGAASCGGNAPPTPTITSTVAVSTSGAGAITLASAPPPYTAAPATTATQADAPATTVSATTILSIADEHIAFTAALPDHHALIGSGRADGVGDGTCTSYWWQLDGGVTLEAWPASCDPANADIGNGSFGHYRSPADAPSPVPTGETSSVLGPATTFEQVYYECTNSCDEWPLDIAVIELSEPVDPEYPTVAVIMTDRDSTADDLAALLDAFGAG